MLCVQNKMASLEAEKIQAVKVEDYSKAANLKAEIDKLKAQLVVKESQVNGLAGQMKTAGVKTDFAAIKKEQGRSPGKGGKKGGGTGEARADLHLQGLVSRAEALTI